MAPSKRQVKAMRHLVCDHCHSLVDFALSRCGKSWSDTTKDGCTFQCLGCWKVDCLTADLARPTDIVKGMERGRVIARKTNGERATENMAYRKETLAKVTVEKEGGTRGQEMKEVDATTGGKMKGRKELSVDVTKRKSVTRMMSGRKEAGKKGTTEKAAGGKSATREMQNGGATLKQ